MPKEMEEVALKIEGEKEVWLFSYQTSENKVVLGVYAYITLTKQALKIKLNEWTLTR